jgi:hypothetical protein
VTCLQFAALPNAKRRAMGLIEGLRANHGAPQRSADAAVEQTFAYLRCRRLLSRETHK